MRARQPDRTGSVTRDGVTVGFDVYGEGNSPTVVLLPTWAIAQTEHWKAQIPVLARRYRVITVEGRGNGRADRPTDPAAYTFAELAADVLAVLDLTNTARAVVAGVSRGGALAAVLAATAPERVTGAVLIGPALGSLAPPTQEQGAHSFVQEPVADDGWARTVLDAFPRARKEIDGLRMLVVCGTRLDGGDLPRPDGVDIRGCVDDLPAHLFACDAAVVQGGLTTTMELVACRRPFVYVPLGDHFEQQRHVRHRLDRYRAGRCLDHAALDPDTLAHALAEQLRTPGDYLPVPTDSSGRAAAVLSELL